MSREVLEIFGLVVAWVALTGSSRGPCSPFCAA